MTCITKIQDNIDNSSRSVIVTIYGQPVTASKFLFRVGKTSGWPVGGKCPLLIPLKSSLWTIQCLKFLYYGVSEGLVSATFPLYSRRMFTIDESVTYGSHWSLVLPLQKFKSEIYAQPISIFGAKEQGATMIFTLNTVTYDRFSSCITRKHNVSLSETKL